MKIVGVEEYVSRSDAIRNPAGSQAGLLPVRDFNSCAFVSAEFEFLFHCRGRERDRQESALDLAQPGRRMVENSVGADLDDLGADYEPQRRQRRDCGNLCPSATSREGRDCCRQSVKIQ